MCLIAGPIISAVAAVSQGNQQNKIAKANAEMMEAQGRYEAEQIRRKLRYTQGEATVAAAANGIQQSGSFLDVILDNEVQGEIDAENAIRNARNNAAIERAKGRNKKQQAIFGAIGGFVGADSVQKFMGFA